MFDYNLFYKRLSIKNNHKKNSFIKNEIANRLLHRIELLKTPPQAILLQGYSDDKYMLQIAKFFKGSEVFTQISPQQKFDMIIDNTSLHLNLSIVDKLEDYSELLNKNGILLFSTFGEDNLRDIQDSSRSFDKFQHINKMLGIKTWVELIQKFFSFPVLESETLNFTYENDFKLLIEDLRDLNEPLSDTKMNKCFGNKKFYFQLSKIEKLSFETNYIYTTKIDKKTKKEQVPRYSFADLQKQLSAMI